MIIILTNGYNPLIRLSPPISPPTEIQYTDFVQKKFGAFVLSQATSLRAITCIEGTTDQILDGIFIRRIGDDGSF